LAHLPRICVVFYAYACKGWAWLPSLSVIELLGRGLDFMYHSPRICVVFYAYACKGWAWLPRLSVTDLTSCSTPMRALPRICVLFHAYA
ncbi:hypothetical protein PIB30_113627, partial [Stylosanthes scabra]|nr:hypothetical protein [Stylosanthes scabra]